MCYHLEMVYSCGHIDSDRRVRCDCPNECIMQRRPNLLQISMENPCGGSICAVEAQRRAEAAEEAEERAHRTMSISSVLNDEEEEWVDDGQNQSTTQQVNIQADLQEINLDAKQGSCDFDFLSDEKKKEKDWSDEHVSESDGLETDNDVLTLKLDEDSENAALSPRIFRESERQLKTVISPEIQKESNGKSRVGFDHNGGHRGLSRVHEINLRRCWTQKPPIGHIEYKTWAPRISKTYCTRNANDNNAIGLHTNSLPKWPQSKSEADFKPVEETTTNFGLQERQQVPQETLVNPMTNLPGFNSKVDTSIVKPELARGACRKFGIENIAYSKSRFTSAITGEARDIVSRKRKFLESPTAESILTSQTKKMRFDKV